MARLPSTKKRRSAWTLTIIAALLAVVWVGSMRWGVGVWWPPRCTLGVGGGQIEFTRSDRAWPLETQIAIEPVRDRKWDVDWWFGSHAWSFNGGHWIRMWHAPLWPFILLTGVPGVWMLIKTRQHANPNACPTWGYDRTGLPQSSTGPAACPECGPG